MILEKKHKQLDTIKKITFDKLVIDFENKILLKENTAFELNDIETQILKILISKKNKIFSRKDIINSVWGLNYFNHSDYRIIDLYISKLRSKIEDEPKNPVYIQTIRGLGYRFFQRVFEN